MFCQKCGSENPENAQFCKSCGAALHNPVAQSNPAPAVPPTFQQPVFQQPVTVQPPKKKKKGKIVGIVVGAIVVLVILGSALGSGDSENTNTTNATTAGNANASVSDSTESKTTKVPEEETIKVSAVDILAEYKANEVGADAKYNGKMVEISGVIDDFGKDVLGTTYITISDGKEFSTNSVQFYFKDDEISKISKLQKGDSVVIIGRCGNFSVFNLLVKNCKLK